MYVSEYIAIGVPRLVILINAQIWINRKNWFYGLSHSAHTWIMNIGGNMDESPMWIYGKYNYNYYNIEMPVT
jgi:hypothetical protein